MAPEEAADEALSLAEAAVRRWNALPMGTEEAQKHQAAHGKGKRWEEQSARAGVMDRMDTGKCWSS